MIERKRIEHQDFAKVMALADKLKEPHQIEYDMWTGLLEVRSVSFSAKMYELICKLPERKPRCLTP